VMQWAYALDKGGSEVPIPAEWGRPQPRLTTTTGLIGPLTAMLGTTGYSFDRSI
jgi:hypothetical protein